MSNVKRHVSLITMGAGNVIALKKTLDSFRHVYDEIIYGDMLLFEEDREVLKEYAKEYPLKIIRLPFNYIFHEGFSGLLNFLISNANNDMAMYMNTSEVIDEDYGINEIIDANPDCNMFYFSHSIETHRWFRTFDRRELQWSGFIHEEPRGIEKPYHKPIFQMRDEEKDMANTFKSKVLNDCKEINYFHNYLKLVDKPKERGATNEGWVKFVADQYEDMKLRLTNKGKRYEAFLHGDYKQYMMDIYSNPEFEKERFDSSDIINFQGNRKIVL